MDAIKRWLKTKTGRNVVGILLVALLGIAILSVIIYGTDLGGLSGTAGLSAPEYPPPQNGYTCLPTCAENDGKFFLISNTGMATFAGSKVVVWISVPGQYKNFELGIFDGDSGLDNSGALNQRGGNWDDTTTEATYSLYADPLKDGSGTLIVGSWNGNQTPMLNNAWYTLTVDTQTEAQGPSLHYFYRLEVTQPLESRGGNAFKIRSNGYLSAGRELLVNSDFAIVGGLATIPDFSIIYPQKVDYRNLGPSTYTGDWQFFFYVPDEQGTLDLWDGDFDRGTLATVAGDTDDPNFVGRPEWAGPFSVDERAGGMGNPPDDMPYIYFRISPPVMYELVDPSGTPIYTNDNPSGTEEWEKFTMSTDPSVNPDLMVEKIQPGFYMVHIQGLDLHNLVFFRTNYEVCDPEDGCGPPPWSEGSCPRTIGYWKNNVKKIYIQNRPRGVQESKESLDWALRNVALASPIFRSGINVNAPTPIADPVPLTPQEADDILQKTNGNSMLDRALQQNLASWLNMASGKIGPTSIVVINVPSGVYEGTMEGALREAENIILNGGDLERAKDIADMINNNMLTTDANEPAADQACSVYNDPGTGVVPSDKQPPTHDKMPKAPKQDEPPAPAPVCTAGNTYTVENTTNNPFYSVKFNFASGTEVKEGGYDTFQYTLPADVVAAMTTMQVEVKAATDSRTYDLACDFTSMTPCGGEPSDDLFAVLFDGALDNGDGTYTLTFTVSVFGQHGLSHVAFSLPEGQTAGGVTENYTADVCQ